jgi:hypothetical protein
MTNGNRDFEAKGGRCQEHLLRPPNFEAKSQGASFKKNRYECEASALTPEPTALNHFYFNPKTDLCKTRALAGDFNRVAALPVASTV